MALSLRHLIAASFGFILMATGLVGQSKPSAEPPPAVFQLFSLISTPDMLYDLRGKPVKVAAGVNGYSEPYAVPSGGNLTFYRLVPSPKAGEPPTRVPVATAAVDDSKGAVSLVVLFPDGPPKEYDEDAPPAPLKSLTLDNSAKAYPPGMMRVLSLSTRPVLIKVGTSVVQPTTARVTLVPYPEGTRTWLHVATIGEEGWQRVIGTPQVLAPNTRLSLFMGDIPPSLHDPRPVGLSLKKIIEPVPLPVAPPAPNSALVHR